MLSQVPTVAVAVADNIQFTYQAKNAKTGLGKK
jgi:hypothetical protein